MEQLLKRDLCVWHLASGADVSCLFKIYLNWSEVSCYDLSRVWCSWAHSWIFSEGKHHWSHRHNWQFQQMLIGHGRGTEQPLGIGLGKRIWGDRASLLSNEPDAKLFAEEILLYACWQLPRVELTPFLMTWHSLSPLGQITFGEQFGVALWLSLYPVLHAGRQSFFVHQWLLFCSGVLGVWDILKHQTVDRSWARTGGAEVILTEERRARPVTIDCFTSMTILKCWEGAGDFCWKSREC